MSPARRSRSALDAQAEHDPQRLGEREDILAQLKLTYAERLAYFTASMRSLEKLKSAAIRPQTPAERAGVRRARGLTERP